LGEEEVKSDFAQSLSVFTAEVGESCYFNGFHDDSGMIGLYVGYDLCSIEVGTLFCLC
jgi:hypothetical protein